MTQPEFLAWVEFFKLNPFDDFARYYRPAVAASMQGADPDELLRWLVNEKRPPSEGLSDADLATMKAFGMKPRKT